MKTLSNIGSKAETKDITVKEMLDDISTLENSYENTTKKEIAAKYGIESKKTAEIRQNILLIAAESRSKRTNFDENDVKAFKLLTNLPETYAKIQVFFANEPEAFIKYLKEYYDAYLEEHKLEQFKTWKPSDLKYGRIPYGQLYSIKIWQFIVKWIEENGSDNKEARDAHEETIELILGKLDAQLKDFKRRLLDNAEEQALGFYDDIKENSDSWRKKADAFKKQREDIIAAAAKTRSGWYWDNPDYKNAERAEKVWIAKWNNAQYIMKRWTKEEYGKYCRNEAGKEYEYKKHTMAEKIAEKGFDYNNLVFTNAKEDPKWLQMMITDGVKKVFARSIIAAEFSDKVKVHFRFIITDRKQ